jgi:hypothetical protein
MYTEYKSKVIESENIVYRMLENETEKLEKGFKLSVKIDNLIDEKIDSG